MSIRMFWLSAACGLAAFAGCATLPSQPVAGELPPGARCTVRVWDRQNPNDASAQTDYWGTIAAADAEKIVLVSAGSEPVAGKLLLDDPKALPPAIWSQRLKSQTKGKFTLRRDQVLAVELLSETRVRQIMRSYPPGTRVNVRICDAAQPYDRSRYQDVWGTVSKTGDYSIELKDAQQEVVAASNEPGADRHMTDAVRAAHLKVSGGGHFLITPDRIISIDWIESRPEKPLHASESAFDFKSVLF